MSATPAPFLQKWKWAITMGCAISLLSGIGGLYVPSPSANETLSRLVRWFNYIGTPGEFVGFEIFGEGSGSTLGTCLLVIPINTVVCTFLFYGVIAGIGKLPRSVVIVLGAILGIVLMVILVPRIRKFNHYRSAYRSLRLGESKTEVLQEWGPPSSSSACMYFSTWNGNPIPAGAKGCVEEIWYSSPITAEDWGIGFDADGRIISNYHSIRP